MLLYIFRFGLPLGSAFITATVFDTIFGFFWVLLHYCSYINAVLQLPEEVVEKGYFENLQWSFFISLRAMLAILLWIGVVFMGSRRALIFWTITSILDDLAIMVNIIFNQIHYQEKFPDKYSWLVVVNVISFVIFRLYISSIAIQVLRHLGKDYENSDDSFPDSEVDSVQPLGQGLAQVWDFYKDFPSGGASVLITAELLWNTFNLLTRGLTDALFGRSLFISPGVHPEGYLALEETIVRCVRIFLAVLGLLFIKKIKPTLMRIWICCYLFVLIVSLGIFFAMVRIWETPTFYRIFFYSIYILMDNIFRSLILYFSVKFSITYRRTIVPDSYYL